MLQSDISRLALARVRRDHMKYLKSEKTFLNLALLCVIDSVDLHFGRTFSIKILLHILGQNKRKILQRKYFAYYIYFFNNSRVTMAEKVAYFME